MHNIEPYYNWNHLYNSSEDIQSPFYDREHSEFTFTDKIYDHVIHPQWENMGSPTLFIKILFADYETGYCIIEFIGEWNDCIENDIMTFLYEVMEPLQLEGITKFILIGENLLNFFSSDDEYYMEWNEANEDGWVCLVNFRQHVLDEMSESNIDHYWVWGGELNDMEWRKNKPSGVYDAVSAVLEKRLV
jgi:hypothetical protein